MRLIITAILLASLSACATHNFNGLRRGMTAVDTSQFLVGEPLLNYQCHGELTKNYRVELFKRSNAGAPAQNYYLVYKNEKLDFWGYPYELARAPEPEINAVLDEVEQYRHKLPR